MPAVTDAGVPADTALNALLNSLGDTSLATPGASFDAINSQGQDVITTGTAMTGALDAATQVSDASLHADLAVMKGFWTDYAMPLGEIAAEATSYDALIEAARPLIESGATITANEATARQNVASAYTVACTVTPAP